MPTEGGVVQVSPKLSSYRADSSVTLTALPSVGYVFGNWTGDIDGITDPSQPTVTFLMANDRTITANFVASSELYVIAAATSPSVAGSVALDPNGPNYEVNQVVSVVACPSSEGYVFSHWSGDLTGPVSTASLLVNGNKSITAVFNLVLDLQKTPDDGGTVEAIPSRTPNGYPAGTVVSLNARPSLGYLFERWTGEVAGISDVNRAAATVAMDTPRTVRANFVVSPPLKVTTDAQDERSGSVTLQPAQPSEGYRASQEIKAYAVASTGYVFSHWAGDVGGSNPILTLTIDSEKRISAVFDPIVMTECDPVEGGTVEVTSPQLSGGYPLGTEITVEAVAAEGYRFQSWEGDVSGSENPAGITMDSPKTLTAHFVKESRFTWWWIPLGIAGVLLLLAALRLFWVIVIKGRGAILPGPD